MRCLLLAALVACAKVPSEPSFGNDVGITLDDAMHVYFGPYTMDFAAPPMLQLPISLQASGEELFVPPVSCMESAAGVQIYPVAMANASARGTSSHELVLGGPAVVRVAVTWSLDYTCQGTAQTLSGVTTYTFFPSGRVDRLDEMAQASTTKMDSNIGCGCNTTGSDWEFFFTSFWAFAKVIDIRPDNTPVDSTYRGPGCAQSNTHTIAVRYVGDDVRHERAGAYIHDLAPPTFMWMDTTQKSASSSISIAPAKANCADVLAGLVDPPLMIDGSPVAAAQGVYYDGVSHSDTVTITGDVPHGFAVQLYINGATHARVEKDGSSVPFSIEFDAAAALFWFPDPLQSGETITIEPM